MRIVRFPLPKTRKWRLVKKLREGNLIGRMDYGKTRYIRNRFVVWIAHSRWVWWNFHRDGK